MRALAAIVDRLAGRRCRQEPRHERYRTPLCPSCMALRDLADDTRDRRRKAKSEGTWPIKTEAQQPIDPQASPEPRAGSGEERDRAPGSDAKAAGNESEGGDAMKR